MTREEAIKELSVEYFGDSEKIREAKKMAIKALNQEPCGDAISRQAVLDLMHLRLMPKEEYMAVYNLPSVQPKPRKGHWVSAKVGRFFPSNDYKCSKCGNILDFDGVNCGRGDANFCPNCGADMRGEQE